MTSLGGSSSINLLKITKQKNNKSKIKIENKKSIKFEKGYLDRRYLKL